MLLLFRVLTLQYNRLLLLACYPPLISVLALLGKIAVTPVPSIMEGKRGCSTTKKHSTRVEPVVSLICNPFNNRLFIKQKHQTVADSCFSDIFHSEVNMFLVLGLLVGIWTHCLLALRTCDPNDFFLYFFSPKSPTDKTGRRCKLCRKLTGNINWDRHERRHFLALDSQTESCKS